MAGRLTTYDIGKLRNAYLDIERQSFGGPLKEHVLPFIDVWLQILLECHGFAIDCRVREEHPTVMESFASVSSVAYCNAECARNALVRGFYGNAFALARALAMANDLVIDLVKTEESSRKWLALREFKPGKGGNKAKRLRDYFKDEELRKRVKDLGEYSPSSDLYSILSEPVHTSPWSTHMYSHSWLTDPDQYSIEYRPQYHPGRALMCGGLIVLTLPHLSGYFLEWCEERYGEDGRLMKLADRHTRTLQAYETSARVHREVLDTLGAAYQRVRDGESFEDVFKVPGERTGDS